MISFSELKGPSSRPLLSLVMIVKDEASNIRAVLEVVKPFIDRWTILDTGSTDGTQDMIREVLGQVPGRLVEEPFVDFATSRNRVLELEAEGEPPAVFSLMLSADEYLVEGAALREYLEAQRDTEADCHFIRLQLDDSLFYTPRVFRTGSMWKYVGVVHEVPVHPDSDAPTGKVPQTMIQHLVSDEERRLSSIWDKHIPLLEARLEDAPEDTHALMFLGQSYETFIGYLDPGERKTVTMKAMSMYSRRLDVDRTYTRADELERERAKTRYLDCARQAGVYNDKEFYERAQALVEDLPNDPDAAMLLLVASMKIVPAAQIYELACKTATLVGDVINNTDKTVPVSTSLYWKSHLIAAKAAKQLAAKYPDVDTGDGLTYDERARAHAQAGLDAKGPEQLFYPLLNRE